MPDSREEGAGENVIPLRTAPVNARHEAERAVLRMVASGDFKIRAEEMVPILARAIVELLDARDAPQS